MESFDILGIICFTNKILGFKNIINNYNIVTKIKHFYQSKKMNVFF